MCQDAEANAVAFEPFGADAKLREAETIDFRDPVQLSKDVIVQASWGAGMPTLGRVVVVVVRRAGLVICRQDGLGVQALRSSL